MSFSWINWVNGAAVAVLLLINGIAARKGLAGRFNSRYPSVNVLEQIGRYGCMILMILPVFVSGWKFGFGSVEEMVLWLGLTVLLLAIYSFLWSRKANGGAGVLYGLAIVPAVLFLLNGVLLRHPMLIAAALLFGVCHGIIVRENVGNQAK